MKAALLCNGPSKDIFEHPEEYDYLMGCNIPWTPVDSTVILDVEVVKYLAEHPEIVKYPIWFSRSSWGEIHRKTRNKIEHYVKCLVDTREGESTGHVALKKLIELGFTEIDIYGCDSYFEDTVKSSTHEYVNTSPTNPTRHLERWRSQWDNIIDVHEECTIKFIWKE